MGKQNPVFYMAPMIGITDSCFRTAFMNCFGGFDLGISPFIRTLQGQRYKVSSFNDIHPNRNKALTIFPQILTNQVDDFIHLAELLFEMGYPIINLNMGCPVPTTAGRGRGAGLLPELDLVDQMLEKVLTVIPNRLSIKTRIGLEAEDDLLKMSRVLNRYPLHEIIIHPRTAQQKYGGVVNHEAFALASEALNHEIVYSGDIVSSQEFEILQDRYPKIRKWMVGRGILYDPLLMRKIRNYDVLPNEVIATFFRELTDLYAKQGLSPHIILSRLKTLLVYLGVGYRFPPSVVKGLRKAKNLEILFAQIPF